MAVTVLLHVVALVLCFRMVFLNTSVALPLSVIEISLEPEPEPKPVEIRRTRISASPAVSGRKVEETPPEPTKPAEIDDRSGDVEVPVEEPIPVQIDERGLFRSQDTGEVEATASGSNPDSRGLFAGSPGPDTGDFGDGSGFAMIGRSIIGKLAQPANTSNRDGKVMVEIIVDHNGQVTKAKAGVPGTTIQDATLWKAAEEAARKTRFSKVTSPPLQTGIITYVFRLK